MSTPEIDIRLGLYLDGELDSQARADLDRELAGSADLRERLERLKRASRELQNFYSDSQMIHSPNDLDEDIVVERIVRESTMQGRRSEINRSTRKRPSLILAASVGLTLFAALFLFLRTYMSGDPGAPELIEGAQRQLTNRFLEAEVKLPILGALVGVMDSDFGDLMSQTHCRLRTGPQGLFHLRLTSENDSETLLQVGFDGKSGYIWKKGDESAKIMSLTAVRENPYVNMAMLSWETILASLEEGLKHPEALELVGKVKEGVDQELWKVRLGGPMTEHRARYWFSKEGELRRVAMGPVEFDINGQAKLTAQDFAIESIFPNMPIKEDL